MTMTMVMLMVISGDGDGDDNDDDDDDSLQKCIGKSESLAVLIKSIFWASKVCTESSLPTAYLTRNMLFAVG